MRDVGGYKLTSSVFSRVRLKGICRPAVGPVDSTLFVSLSVAECCILKHTYLRSFSPTDDENNKCYATRSLEKLAELAVLQAAEARSIIYSSDNVHAHVLQLRLRLFN